MNHVASPIRKIDNKTFGLIDNALVSYKYRQIEKGIVYEIAIGKYKERCFFECTRSGKILIKYRLNQHTGKDNLLIKGTGRLSPRPDLTEGINYGR